MPVLSEDGALPAQETEWKCSSTLARLNLGGRGGGVALCGAVLVTSGFYMDLCFELGRSCFTLLALT